MTAILINCPKCNGRGTFRAFSHIADGKCFTCSGSGKLSSTSSKVSAAMRAGMTADAAYEASKARAATRAQEMALTKIAIRLNTSENRLVCAALGLPLNNQPEFTKEAVSKAISMFGHKECAAA